MKSYFFYQSLLPGVKLVCDFDGTITPYDTTDALLARFAPPAWEDIERAWIAGEITAFECMARQISLLNMEKASLDAFLDEIPLADGVADFISFVRLHQLDFIIISDGLDYSINRVLTRHGLSDIKVAANNLILNEEKCWLNFPYRRADCGCGVCKCAVAGSFDENFKKEIILIGDGRSDFCLADRASLILAKRGLALEGYCRDNKLNYLSYDDFTQVLVVIKTLGRIIPELIDESYDYKISNIYASISGLLPCS